MTWVKLDDTCPDHPAIVGLSDAAFACWVRGLCYASRHLTDGLLPRTALRSLGTPKAARELEEAGRWESVDGGWQIHGYEERQRTRGQVELERTKWKERQNRHRSVTPASRRDKPVSHAGVTPPELETEVEVETDGCTSSAAATTSHERRRLLEEAAAIIGDRAAQRPGTRDPAATARAVTRGVITDRHQDAYAAIAANPTITATQLAQHLEPVEAAPTRPPLPPNCTDERIANLDPPPPQRIPDELRAEGLAQVRALAAARRSPDDAA